MTITKQQFDAAVEAERPKWGQFAGLWEEAIASIRDRLFPAESYTYDPAKPDRIVVGGREYEITERIGGSSALVWLDARDRAVMVLDDEVGFLSCPWAPRDKNDRPADAPLPADLIPAVVALIRQHVGGGE